MDTMIKEDRVIELPLLSPGECKRVEAEVHALRKLWQVRCPGSYKFYTLGAASYLDFSDYYAKAAAFNPELDKSFAWLYDYLRAALSDCLKRHIVFEPRAARPGFHIFPPNGDLQIPEGNRHFDMQYLRIDWTERQDLDFSDPISYTLAIRLPRSGGGLNIWSVTKKEFDGMDKTTRDAVLDRTLQYVPYSIGHLVCHSGLLLHTTAPCIGQLQRDDVRLTLQGHALRCKDTYILYW
jgi:hypothetical protein